MCHLLDLPEKFVTTNRTTMPKLEGLCLLIYCLSHPCRFKDLKLLFPRSEGALSELFNCILEYVYESWKHLLLFDHVRLSPQVLEEFAEAIHLKGGENSLDNCWAFLDGTHVRVCHPEVDQEELYSGQKKCHTIKFQALTSPDGIIVHLGGPFSGRRHDAQILTMSKLLSFLHEHSVGVNGCVLVVYGDEGYARCAPVLAPFHGGEDPIEVAANEAMRRPRLCVEWAFAFISNNWSFSNERQKLRT